MTTVALSDVAQINPRGERIFPEQPVSFVGMAELDAVTATARPLETRPFGDVSKGYTVFRDRDVLVAKITPCFENGKVGQAVLDHPIGVGSTEFHVVRPGDDLDARYLLHFLRRPAIRATGSLRMTGSGGQRRVPVSYLQELEIPLPTLPEQRRIASILDHIDAVRTKRRQVLAHLDSLSQSIFNNMFSGGVWPTGPLAEVVRAGTLVTYGIVQAGPEVDGGVPYIRTGDIVGGQIVTAGLRHTDPAIAARFERSTVRAGDIVMSIRATVGTTAVVPPDLDGANLTQGTARIAPSEKAIGPYLLECLRSPEIQHWIQGQIKGATFREITLGRLRELEVPLPPLRLQEAFAARVDCVNTQAAAGRRALKADADLFASLQSRAFRGEL